MNNKITIREAKIQDRATILNLIQSFAPHDVKFAKRYYDLYFEDSPVTQEDWVIVAEMKHQVMGVCGYCTDYFGNAYYLSWFGVGEKYRGNGDAAAKLLAAVENDLRRYRVKKLFVETEDHLGRGHGFYLKHGFQFEGRLKDYYGKGYDQIILGKPL